jgi:RNA polymerase sigma-70 factor, ECF subfamily
MCDNDGSMADRIALAHQDSDARGRLLVEFCERELRGLADREVGRGLKGPLSASDIIQQTIIEADRAFGTCPAETERGLFRWLRKIFLHNVIDVGRRRRLPVQPIRPPHQDSDDRDGRDPPADDTRPSERAVRNERECRLRQALSELPERQRLAVTLHILEGRSGKEVAARLGCTPSAAAGLVKRGVNALREKLGQDSRI